MNPAGKYIVIAGIIIIIAGILVGTGTRLPFLGRLPGDIYIKKGAFALYLPLATCFLISLVLTLILRFFFRK